MNNSRPQPEPNQRVWFLDVETPLFGERKIVIRNMVWRPTKGWHWESITGATADLHLLTGNYFFSGGEAFRALADFYYPNSANGDQSTEKITPEAK